MSRKRPQARGAGPLAAMALARAAQSTSRPDQADAAGSAALRLDPVCTMRELALLKSGLLARLEEPRPVCLDAGALERIDTGALQLLVAFVRDRRAAGRSVTWAARSDALDRAARALGLQSALGLESDA